MITKERLDWIRSKADVAPVNLLVLYCRELVKEVERLQGREKALNKLIDDEKPKALRKIKQSRTRGHGKRAGG